MAGGGGVVFFSPCPVDTRATTGRNNGEKGIEPSGNSERDSLIADGRGAAVSGAGATGGAVERC